jgi:putative cell wall-binding protein
MMTSTVLRSHGGSMRSRLLATLLAAVLLAMIAPASAFAGLDDVFPASSLPASPVHGTLTYPVDKNYYVDLAAGDELTLSLTAAARTDFSLSLYYGDAPIAEWNALFFLSEPSYPKETSYVVPAGRGGRYYVKAHTLGVDLPSGDYTLTWSKRQAKAARLYGLDRYATAAAISRSMFSATTSGVAVSDTAVIASGENYPDALAASGLAGALHAPVLLTHRDSLPDVVAWELQRLGVTKVKIIGSGSVVSTALADALADPDGTMQFDVERIGGANRFDTARAVALKIMQCGGSREAFLVSGRGYADALAVAPLAYARKMPVLLTEPTSLSAEASAALASLDSTHVVIAGSGSAVATSVANAAGAVAARNDAGGGHAVDRWQGVNRYETAVDVATHAVGMGWATWDAVGLATGKNFPDALGGGAALGEHGGVLLLTESWRLSDATRGALAANKAAVGRAYLLGSSSAINEAVRTAATAALQ